MNIISDTLELKYMPCFVKRIQISLLTYCNKIERFLFIYDIGIKTCSLIESLLNRNNFEAIKSTKWNYKINIEMETFQAQCCLNASLLLTQL